MSYEAIIRELSAAIADTNLRVRSYRMTDGWRDFWRIVISQDGDADDGFSLSSAEEVRAFIKGLSVR